MDIVSKKQWDELIETLEESKKIIILRHQSPDGDALGSQFGLYHFLKHNFKTKEVFSYGEDEAKYLNPLFPKIIDAPTDDSFKDALVVIVDCANVERISTKGNFKKGNKFVKIDHHINKGIDDSLYNLLIVNPKASSCSEMISDFLFYWISKNDKLSFPSVAKENLLLGIITDTGSFRFSSTAPNALYQASQLKKEISHDHINKINESLYSSSEAMVRFEGYVLQNFKLHNNVASIMIPKGAEKTFNISYLDISSKVNILLKPIETLIGAYCTYDSEIDEYRISLRSKQKNVQPICAKYGGGGHEKACGIKIKNPDEFNKILEDLFKFYEK